MHCIHQIRNVIVHNTFRKQNILYAVIINIEKYKNINENIFKSFCTSKKLIEKKNVPKPLRRIKPRAKEDTARNIIDLKQV